MKNDFLISNLQLDYLKFTGYLRGFNAKNMQHRDTIKKYLEDSGYKETKSGSDWVYYENKDFGMRAFFSNFPMNNKQNSKRPSLSLEFTGHYFINENSYLSCRELVRYFSDNFGVFFKINRVDIRQDIYNAKYPFDYFPNFQKDDQLIWALRGNPSFNQYNHDFSDQATGFTIKTSRYTMMSYNRNMALEDRYKKGEISEKYYKYYKNLYGNRDVQRLEISLKMDACDFFGIIFFRGEISEEDVLKMTMANFGRNHALKKLKKDTRINKMPVDEVFSELFYLDEKDNVKYFKKIFQEKTGIKLSELSFSEKGRSINEIISMLAKKVCEHAKGDDSSRETLLNDAITILKVKAERFKDLYIDRRDRYKKVLNYMHFRLDEMIKTNRRITGFYLQEIT